MTARSYSLEVPGDPKFKWVPQGKTMVQCMIGMFLFSTCFFFLFTFKISILTHSTGSFANVVKMLGIEIAVIGCYKARQGELFAVQVLNKPGFLTAFVGVVIHIGSVLVTSTAPAFQWSIPTFLLLTRNHCLENRV